MGKFPSGGFKVPLIFFFLLAKRPFFGVLVTLREEGPGAPSQVAEATAFTATAAAASTNAHIDGLA